MKRRRIQVYKNQGPSLTEQHHAKACDINAIMAKYLKTGLIEHMSRYEPTFGDISECDYKRSLDTMKAVESEFYNLPAYVRQHFDDDASNYLEAVSTPEGIEALKNLKPPGQQYNRDGTRDTEAVKASEGKPAPAEQEPAEGDKTVT